MNHKKSNIPNFISSLRIIGTAALLFIEPFTTAFYVIYTLCGITDTLDGTIARATNSTTALGARLDSMADLLFYAIMLFKIFPELWERLPGVIWYVVAAAVIIRIASYLVAAIKYHRFASVHTYMNKLMNLIIFATPYFVKRSFSVPFCFTVAIIGVLSSLEELLIHITNKEYSTTRKTIFQKRTPVK